MSSVRGGMIKKTRLFKETELLLHLSDLADCVVVKTNGGVTPQMNINYQHTRYICYLESNYSVILGSWNK